MSKARQFSNALLAWFDEHGRKDLPWQQNRNAYSVWISEIMLQQTQVATVIDYYQRFMKRFHDVQTLAAADIDEVLTHWAGLGYYARGRNLHKAARLIVNEHHGELPTEIEALIALPGIGRSTAGAILSLAHHQRHPILDGNVKRVLARQHAIAGWPGVSSVTKQLWELAEICTPQERVADYTQAIMDLGATLCTRSKPACMRCPVANSCAARAAGNPQNYPGKKPRKEKPQRRALFLLISNEAGELLMQRRPPTGIWGGLWSVPEVPLDEQGAAQYFELAAQHCETLLNEKFEVVQQHAGMRHSFTHFDLHIEPVEIHAGGIELNRVEDDPDQHRWLNPQAATELGLPAPVSKILKHLIEAPDRLL